MNGQGRGRGGRGRWRGIGRGPWAPQADPGPQLVMLSGAEAAELAEHADVPVVLVESCRRPMADGGPHEGVPLSPPPTADERSAHELATRLLTRGQYSYEAELSPRVPAVREAFRLHPRRALHAGSCDASAVAAQRRRSPDLLYAEIGRVAEGRGGLRVLLLPAGTLFFKGTRYFYDDASAELPFMWVGNAPTAIEYAQRFQGGCMVYRATRELALLLLDQGNIERLHGVVSALPPDAKKTVPEAAAAAAPGEGEPPTPPHLDPQAVSEAMRTKFGVGVPLHEQVRRVREYKGLQPSEPLAIFQTRPQSRFTFCRRPERTFNFGAGRNDRVVAAFMHSIRGILGVDGWFSPESYTPYFCSLSEELLLFSGGEAAAAGPIVELVRDHPLFWRSWFAHLPLGGRLPAAFDLSPGYFRYNRGFAAVRSALAYEDARAAAGRRSGRAVKRGAADRLLLTVDVHSFRSPNALETKDAACDRLAALLLELRPDVAVIQAVPPALVDRLLDAVRAAYPAAARVPNYLAEAEGADGEDGEDGEEAAGADGPDARDAKRQLLVVLVSSARAKTAELRPLPHETRIDVDGDVLVARQDSVEVTGLGGALEGAAVLCVGLANGRVPVKRGAVSVEPLELFARITRANSASRLGHLRSLGVLSAAGRRSGAAVLLGRLGAWPGSQELHAIEDGGFGVGAFLSGLKPYAGAAGTTLNGAVEDYALLRRRAGAGSPAVECAWETLPWALGVHAPVLATFRPGASPR